MSHKKYNTPIPLFTTEKGHDIIIPEQNIYSCPGMIFPFSVCKKKNYPRAINCTQTIYKPFRELSANFSAIFERADNGY